MKRRRPDLPPHGEPGPSSAERFLWWVLQGTLFGIGVVYSAGIDVFRLPKLLLLEAAALLLFAACAAVSLLAPQRGILQRLREHRAVVIIAAAAVAWTAVATAFSTQRALSLETLFWVVCCALYFHLCLALGAPRSMTSAAVALAAPLATAVAAVLQRLEIWTPYTYSLLTDRRTRTIGFIGNANDLGAYLLAPALAAMALAVVHRGRARIGYGAAALAMFAGIAVCETLTAFLALGVAAVVILLMISTRKAVRVALAAAVVIAVLVTLQLPLGRRLRTAVSSVASGEVNIAVSGRLQGFAAAWAMFTDHPMTGVGPGCFALWYLPYNTAVAARHPEYMNAGGQRFAQVHNDHLQLLATAGLPAYLILLAALWRLGMSSRGAPATGRKRFAQLFALPAALASAVMMLGAFPLELAAPVSSLFYWAALAVAWSTRS